MDNALAGNAIAQDEEVPRSELPFEFMLNALRLKDGFVLQDFSDRTGLPLSAIEQPLQEAQAKGTGAARLRARETDRARASTFLQTCNPFFLPAEFSGVRGTNPAPPHQVRPTSRSPSQTQGTPVANAMI
jgi:oxygen-independent coproporphyrinogen-3 oxidase